MQHLGPLQEPLHTKILFTGDTFAGIWCAACLFNRSLS